MTGKLRALRWLFGAAVLAAAEIACVAAIQVAISVPAEAQRVRGRGGGFFDQLFGPFNQRSYQPEPQQQYQQAPADYSRAPGPRKSDSKAEPVTPTTSIMVMGDGMADWLAYGLEDAFADTPEVAIVRKSKDRSGLVHYDSKGDLDWWHVARDILSKEKANYVVMMLGVADRQNIRERDLAEEGSEGRVERRVHRRPEQA
jgi:hypothetical protein